METLRRGARYGRLLLHHLDDVFMLHHVAEPDSLGAVLGAGSLESQREDRLKDAENRMRCFSTVATLRGVDYNSQNSPVHPMVEKRCHKV